jgi:hypothetical protein
LKSDSTTGHFGLPVLIVQTISGHYGGKDEAAELGWPNKVSTAQRLSTLGRNGKISWCEKDVTEHLFYLCAKNLVLVPVAHAILRGLLRGLLEFALKTQVSSVPDDHPIVFNGTERNFVSVCPLYICHS